MFVNNKKINILLITTFLLVFFILVLGKTNIIWEVVKIQDKLGSILLQKTGKSKKSLETFDVTTKNTSTKKIEDPKTNLKKTTIIIDPGHGGEDLGTIKNTIYEKNINLDIAKKLKNYLVKDGYKVNMTRDKDVFLAKKSNIRGTLELRDLCARTSIVNRSSASLYVSIHVNSFPTDTSINGSMVYYKTKDSLSKILAMNVQNELNAITINGIKRFSNSPCTADYYILKNTSIPGVLIETGYLTNKEEMKSLLLSSYRDSLAKAIYSGIKKYCSKQ